HLLDGGVELGVGHAHALVHADQGVVVRDPGHRPVQVLPDGLAQQRHGARPVHVRGLAGHVHGRLLAASLHACRSIMRSGGSFCDDVPMNPTVRTPTEPCAPDSWRSFPAPQRPDWPEPAALDRVLAELASQPPLVFAGEARTLQSTLATVASGHGFLLQAGDCAETFDAFSADSIRDKLKVILQMAVILTYGAGLPVVKVGRIAGQFAKPRSLPSELVDGVDLPVYRGDMVNELGFQAAARRADPARVVGAHTQPPGTPQPAPGPHQGWLRRPQPGPQLEPGVRGPQPVRAAL